MTRAFAALALAWVALGSPALADPEPQYTPEQAKSAILSGPRPCPSGRSQQSCEADPLTRRWCIGESCMHRSPPPQTATARAPAAPAGRPAGRQAPPQPRLSSADILVTFQSGSSEITPQGRANLRSMARALNSDSLGSLNFEVAGYTDASGNELDNFLLSGRRADAVRDFLVSLGVRGERLSAAPYGSAHLADPGDPRSPLNRRVELHRLN
ncbi:OmpA family protein [Caulobacter sp. KR2-114]|uniref:OmpA family protein n=1 Tax=Caulobacter sp. KR2-114 TaxID=3400912 RepID=UPI003BFC02DC